MRKVLISTALVVVCVATAVAQAPKATVCFAQFSGPEAKNWNLRPPIMKEVEAKIEARQLSASLVTLKASDEKHANAEAAEKKCTFIVFSQVERRSSEVSSVMEPSPTMRASANLNAPQSASKLTYNLKVNDASGKRMANDKIEVELLSSFTPKEYEERGRTLVNKVSDKIVAVISKH